MFKKFKNSWGKFLATIAEQNEATYGKGGINCCELKDVTVGKNNKTRIDPNVDRP